jgi:hypothetical protein
MNNDVVTVLDGSVLAGVAIACSPYPESIGRKRVGYSRFGGSASEAAKLAAGSIANYWRAG